MINWSSLTSEEKKAALARPAMSNNAALQQNVSTILDTVKSNGDEAVLSYTRQFDCTEANALELPAEQWDRLCQQVDEDVKQAIGVAYDNIKAFHSEQMPEPVIMETTQGVVCEQHFAPLDAVGLYVPGGTAPLPSTVLMLGIPAAVAKCPIRILCTPPNDAGLIAPEIAYAAKLCEVQKIYLCGGAQAIAAMAFGTKSIVKVDKIYGPGNSYVTEAKQQVSQTADGAAIDMPAGPSEVLVLADSQANPEFVAADLLSQAEHGVDSQAVLVSDCESLITATQKAVAQQLAQLTRAEIAQAAMQHARFILACSADEAVEISNCYAPEHLIVHMDDAVDRLPAITNAGSIFVGQWSPESAGDYASGTNHVLPTYGYAKNYSSLGLIDFMRRYTVQTLSQTGIRYLGPTIMRLAAAEGLTAHENAVKIRLNALDNKENWHGKLD